MIKKAYGSKWEKFMSSVLKTFTPFIDGSDTFTSSAKVVWFFLVTETKGEFVDEISSILDRYIDRINLFMLLEDEKERKAIDVATRTHRQLMLERSYLFRRYEVRDGLPEHVSETCKVFLARDHTDSGRNVALKFIRLRDHFKREKNVRHNCSFDDKFVIKILLSYDGDDDKDKIFGDEAERKGYYRYCLVMPAAERNLGTVLVHEHIAGRDWDQLRVISKQILEALHHVHEKGYIHGDVKRKRFYSFNICI